MSSLYIYTKLEICTQKQHNFSVCLWKNSALVSFFSYLLWANFKNIFFSPSNSNFLFVIYLNLLSEYWFCKIYDKKLISQIQVLSNCVQPDWAEEASPFAGFSSSWIDFIISLPVVFRVHHGLSLLVGRKQAAPRLQGTIAETVLFRFSTHSNFNLLGTAVEKLFAWNKANK